MKSTVCFFDDYFITARPGTVRRTFKPEKIGYLNDKQSFLQTYTSMFYDPRVKKLRLYVEVPHYENDTEIRDLIMFEGDDISDFIGDGSKLSRAVVQGFPTFVHGSSVFYDERATDPGKRYVFAGNVDSYDLKKQRLAVAFSSDGINFGEATTIYDTISDTYNSLYFNEAQNQYELTFRSAWGDRRISVMRSDDLINWTKPQMILHPSANGGNGMEYYAFGVNRLDGMYYGINWRFITDIMAGDFSNMIGYMENDLYYSYDGDSWVKTDLSPIADRPLPPEYGSKQLWLSNVCDDHKGKFIIVGGAARISHGGTEAYLGEKKFVVTTFYSIRKHGFVGLEGFGKGSRVVTKPFVFNGGTLEINANACLGGVTVAVLDSAGKPYEGFSHDDCEELRFEDLVDSTVRWKNASLDSLVGKTARFEVVLNNSILFSLSYDGSPGPLGVSKQPSYHKPARK